MYLFGSRAKGKIKSKSDVDIAVLYEPETVPIPHQALDMRNHLERLLGQDVDFVVLNLANPILRHQVLKTGSVILMNDQKCQSRFICRTISEYDDTKRMRKVIEQKMMDRATHG